MVTNIYSPIGLTFSQPSTSENGGYLNSWHKE